MVRKNLIEHHSEREISAHQKLAQCAHVIQVALASRKTVAKQTVVSKAQARLHYFIEHLIFLRLT